MIRYNRSGKMQCKDIPDGPILAFLSAHGGTGCTVWRDLDGTPYERSALRAMPEGVHENLARAKMKKMISRGLVEGCSCGCRGDYGITTAGRAALELTRESMQ